MRKYQVHLKNDAGVVLNKKDGSPCEFTGTGEEILAQIHEQVEWPQNEVWENILKKHFDADAQDPLQLSPLEGNKRRSEV